MGTYIIHFDDKPWEDLDDELYYRCFEIPWFSTTKTTISRLTPYTEDSAYAHGYTEAESKYREIKDELEKQAYEKGVQDTKQHWVDAPRSCAYKLGYENGLNDAWEAARKICLEECDGGMQISVIKDIFNVRDYRYALRDYSASEAIEKIRTYEQAQKEKEEQIQVGDEVNAPFGKAIVVNINSVAEKIWLVYADGRGGFEYFKDAPTKTGRHFPEIAEVFAKMKETDNG